MPGRGTQTSVFELSEPSIARPYLRLGGRGSAWRRLSRWIPVRLEEDRENSCGSEGRSLALLIAASRRRGWAHLPVAASAEVWGVASIRIRARCSPQLVAMPSATNDTRGPESKGGVFGGRRPMRPRRQSGAPPSSLAYDSLGRLSACSPKSDVNKLRYLLSSPLPVCRNA